MKKNIKHFIFFAAIILSIISCIFFLKNHFIKKNMIEKLDLESEQINPDVEYNTWSNAPDFSLSKDDILKSFNNFIHSSDTVYVITYDGGECNSYIDTVIDGAINLASNNKVLFINNQKQSYLENQYEHILNDITILGDDYNYIAKYMDNYNTEEDSFYNLVFVYTNGKLIHKYQFTPRDSSTIKEQVK